MTTNKEWLLKVHNSCLLIIAVWFLFFIFLTKGVQKAHTWYRVMRQKEEYQAKSETLRLCYSLILYASIVHTYTHANCIYVGKEDFHLDKQYVAIVTLCLLNDIIQWGKKLTFLKRINKIVIGDATNIHRKPSAI